MDPMWTTMQDGGPHRVVGDPWACLWVWALEWVGSDLAHPSTCLFGIISGLKISVSFKNPPIFFRHVNLPLKLIISSHLGLFGLLFFIRLYTCADSVHSIIGLHVCQCLLNYAILKLIIAICSMF